MKACLVIGGCGYIGRHVVKKLCLKGRDVIVLGRSSAPDNLLDSKARYISGDSGDRSLLRRIFSSEMEVVDLAYSTVPKTSYEDAAFDLISNLPASVGLFQEAMRAGVKKVLIVSSGGTVYGPRRRLPIKEDDPTEPISPYGITKLTIDRYALMFHRNNGLPVVIVRPANAYGCQQKSNTGQGFIAAAMDAICSNKEVEIYGANGTIRDYIHIEDVAEGIVRALDFGKHGQIYNLGTGKGTSNSEILEILDVHAKKAGLGIKTKFLPSRKFDVEENVLDSKKMKDCCEWFAKTSLEVGLAEMWEEWRSQHDDH